MAPNFRVSVLGGLYIKNEAPGNQMLRDQASGGLLIFSKYQKTVFAIFWGLLLQIASLHWVSENIKSFGGDPSKVRRVNPLIFFKTMILTRIFISGYNIWRISWRRVCCLSPLEVCCLCRRNLDCIKACSNVQSMFIALFEDWSAICSLAPIH